MVTQRKTDWARVHAEAAADAPVAYDPQTDPYDPNDEAAVKEYWDEATLILKSPGQVVIRSPGRPPITIKRPTLNMRVDADVLAHLRQSGKGWQTRVNRLLREAVEKGLL